MALIPPEDIIFNDFKQGLYDADRQRSRSKQIELGASDLASQCDRQIGLKMANPGHGKGEGTVPGYAALKGTAWHKALEKGIAKNPRYMTEKSVDIPGTPMNNDFYNWKLRVVGDHKRVGEPTIKKVRASGPAEDHIDQVHWYTLGWRRAGMVVERVMLLYWPDGNDIEKTYRWSGPVDEDRIADIVARRDRIKATPDPLTLAINTDKCTWCPFLGNLCPGE